MWQESQGACSLMRILEEGHVPGNASFGSNFLAIAINYQGQRWNEGCSPRLWCDLGNNSQLSERESELWMARYITKNRGFTYKVRREA